MQRPLLRSLFLLLLVAIFANTAYSGESFTALVVGISDGDTIKVLRTHPDGRKEQIKIRLYGIDCPEGGQAYGRRAKQFTAKLCAGKTVTLIVRDKDRYGRIVADVILPEGNVVNYELVRVGLAWWYRKYAPNNRSLEAMEAKARAEGQGLWTDPNPVPPWEWRKK